MWLVGVVSRMQVWLKCIGMASGCCCKEVYRYPHNNYYFSLYIYSTCIMLYIYIAFLAIPTSLFIFKMFFRSCIYLFMQTVLVVTSFSALYRK